MKCYAYNQNKRDKGDGIYVGVQVCENDADIMKWVSLQKQFDLTKSNRF